VGGGGGGGGGGWVGGGGVGGEKKLRGLKEGSYGTQESFRVILQPKKICVRGEVNTHYSGNKEEYSLDQIQGEEVKDQPSLLSG